ncbi:ArnT family glycosyltransferase [Sideroxydans lithotrophicus]|uniref:Glycosyl transferase family 39 n=1 Tax=Sideroxydans lithotrophicus (strain ES-1) TaxID=580332 RepID=D5CLJ6_SIDLE|nr:glycosyltransferase family 39 protein [Sideroxydans lithotrophicus]ADE10584.1 glycosyl transferase family 39 [Sideroxydans lithotrophicus ES-1]
MNITHQAKWLILITLLINAAAMLSPIINGGDSITYAALSQHIALNNDWANLVLDGNDWLDKPHMPFWITALFFKLGGVSAFTYILPGFLFHLVGAYYTWRIARLFYGRETAWLSVLVYVSVYHLMDSSIEVKAETYLTGFIMGACYYWLRYDAQAKLKYLLLGALFSACAVMTKGVFTLITITSGLVCMWMYRRQWHKLWSGKWLLALALSLLFTAPEVIALYRQFDLHPEKVVFGQTHVSGIKFFLWDSQFGRFFNTGPIKNTNGNPFYFVLVFLWAFLPWVAVFVAAMVAGARQFFAPDAEGRARFVFLCGAFFVTFLLFSATSFQLDHYTVILFPFAAILCGKFLRDWLARQGDSRVLFIVQLAVAVLLAGLAVGLSVYVANRIVMTVVLGMFVVLLAYGYVMRRQLRAGAVLAYPVFGIAMVYTFLVLTNALTFTACSVAHNAAVQLAGKPDAPVYVYQMDIVARELGLYDSSPCYAVDDPGQLPKTGRFYFLVRQSQLEQLRAHLGRFEQMGQGEWVVHKTGTFPRFLRLAKGTEPLEDIRILQVEGVK